MSESRSELHEAWVAAIDACLGYFDGYFSPLVDEAKEDLFNEWYEARLKLRPIEP